jgi:glycosyltransferase involved in cell wall biosynthesis
MYSVVVLTLNEERSLPACLASVTACDDVVVLDSGSTDRTVEIARAMGARVAVNPFVNFAQQRNHAQAVIPFRHEWVFHLDADEAMTPELNAECHTFVATPESARIDGCYVAPRMMFLGRWIPHCTDYPAYQARFAHAARFRFVQSGHGQREAPGLRMAHLRAGYLHNLSAQPESALVFKHTGYARAEAASFLRSRRSGRELRAALFSGNALQRRRAVKELSYSLPLRGTLRFAYQYLLRGGFLDGSPGFAYCRILARYERDISREIHRLRSKS